MGFETITDVNGLNKLRDVWDNLLEQSSTYAPFATHGWVSNWWQWFGGNRRINIVVAKEGDEVIGIAPLMISKKKSGIRRLEFLIDDNGSRFDFIIIADKKKIFFESFFEFLYNEKALWDECLLNYFPCSSEHYDMLKNQCIDVGFEIEENFFSSPVIKLDKDWDYFLSKKNKKFTGNLRNNIRKVEREKICCRMVSPEEDLDDVVNKIFEIEKNTWKQFEGTALNSDPAGKNFYRDIIFYAAQRGHLYLGLMEKDQEPIAYDFNWKMGDTVFSLKMGYDNRYRKLGPGKVLFAYTVRKSFDDGFKYHELMGINEGFKGEWTQDVIKHSRMHIYHRGIKSRCSYYYNFKIKKIVKQILKRK